MPTRTVETFPERKQLERVRPDLTASVAVTVKNGFRTQQGDVIGKITADGFYRRRARTTVGATAFATNAPTGTVADASVFAVGDVLKNAAGANIGTISAITIATNTITLAANAANAAATGTAISASDGSEVAAGIADKDADGSGNTPVNAIITGLLDESQLRGLDASAKTELGGVSVAGGIFKF
jgi:hypothetical protein